MKPSKPDPVARNTLPTKREVIECLKAEISLQSYRDGDGITRRDALHAIRCLEVALSLVRQSKFPMVKRGR